MAIVHQLDKRSGITYVYESTSYWDKEKKQSRSHRRLIGRLDPETGEVLPTDGRRKNAKERGKASVENKPDSDRKATKPINKITTDENPAAKQKTTKKPNTFPVMEPLDLAEQSVGLQGKLQDSTEDSSLAEKIHRMVRYLAVEPRGELSRVHDWEVAHFEKSVSPETATVSAELVRKYFLKSSEGRQESAYWFYALSYMSSCRTAMSYIQSTMTARNSLKYSRDEMAPGANGCRNLALLIGEDTGLAAAYAEVSGKVTYFEAEKKAEEQLTGSGAEHKVPVRMFMPGELYSRANVDLLLANQVEFLMEVPVESELAKEYILKAEAEDLFGSSGEAESADKQKSQDQACVKLPWKPESRNSYRREARPGTQTLYLHICRSRKEVQHLYLSNVVEDPALALRIDGFGQQMKAMLLDVRDRLTSPGQEASEECVIFPAVLAGGLRNLVDIQRR